MTNQLSEFQSEPGGSVSEFLTVIEPAGEIAITLDGRHAQAALNYLSNLAPASRRTMTQSLAAITDILLDRPPAKSKNENARRVADFQWGGLRAEHTTRIRAALVEACTPGSNGERPRLSVVTANKGLTAMRQVLFESWKLGLIDKDDYERATAFKRIEGRPAPRGAD